MDTDDPNEIATKFCQKHMLGPKTHAQIAEIVERRQKKFNAFQIEYI